MKPEIIEYLKNQNVGVLAVAMPDGSVHGASLHFAHATEPFALYFLTSRNSLKVTSVVSGQKCKASFVIGTDEAIMKTMQLDGELEIITPEHQAEWETIYLAKYPTRREWSATPEAAALKFTPVWWRYSDMKHSGGKLIITSS